MGARRILGRRIAINPTPQTASASSMLLFHATPCSRSWIGERGQLMSEIGMQPHGFVIAPLCSPVI